MALAASLQKVASKIVGVFGSDVDVVISVGAAVYDVATGTVAPGGTDTVITKGVFSEINMTEVGLRVNSNRREMDGCIQAGDRRLIVSAGGDLDGKTVTVDDTVTIKGETHQVIGVTTIELINQPITYELILRN